MGRPRVGDGVRSRNDGRGDAVDAPSGIGAPRGNARVAVTRPPSAGNGRALRGRKTSASVGSETSMAANRAVAAAAAAAAARSRRELYRR